MLIRFDFDGDEFIAPDEVYILLSYIPFKTHEMMASLPVNDTRSPKRNTPIRKGSCDSNMSTGEGMYNR